MRQERHDQVPRNGLFDTIVDSAFGVLY